MWCCARILRACTSPSPANSNSNFRFDLAEAALESQKLAALEKEVHSLQQTAAALPREVQETQKEAASKAQQVDEKKKGAIDRALVGCFVLTLRVQAWTRLRARRSTL